MLFETKIAQHWRFAASPLVICLASLAGCGGSRTYPVAGQLVWSDGQPAKELVGYTVTFESVESQVGSDGVVRDDGTFTVSTYEPDDGAVPGQHRVAITAPDFFHDIDKPRPKSLLPPRYQTLTGSGLEVSIKRTTEPIVLQLERGEP